MRTWVALALFAACGGSDVSRDVGARCDVTADCNERCLSPSQNFPDGFCTLDCATDSDCPSDAACIDAEGGICLFTCVNDVDCNFLGAGWECAEELSRGNPDTAVSVCRGG